MGKFQLVGQGVAQAHEGWRGKSYLGRHQRCEFDASFHAEVLVNDFLALTGIPEKTMIRAITEEEQMLNLRPSPS